MHREQKSVVAKDASKLRIGIVVSDFNSDITDALLEGARATLKEWNVEEENIIVARVAGSFETPYGCVALLSKNKKIDALIALGCIIKGETDHDKYLATSVTDALMRISLDYKLPVASGILTVNSLEQATARTVGSMNRGRESAIAALQSALL